MPKAALEHRPRRPDRPDQPAQPPRSRLDGLLHAVVLHRWPILVQATLSGLLLSLTFAPRDLWPLAYIALVPWLVAVACSQRRTWMFLVSYLLGIGFFYLNLEWLWPVTVWPPQGIFGVQVPIGTLLMAIYLGIYFPIAAWLIRFAYRRLHVPLTLAVPVVWVATEFVRAYLPAVPYDGRWQYTGLQWFFLAHSHYRVLPMIQMADLAGAYGISFLIAVANGLMADLLVWRILHAREGRPVHWPRRLKWAAGLTVAALAGNLIYGVVQLHRDTLEPGPKVAVIQTDYPLFVERGGYNATPGMIEGQVESLVAAALAQNPDIVVLPETMWPYRLSRRWPLEPGERWLPEGSRYAIMERKSRESHERLQQLANDTGATFVVGALSVAYWPDRPVRNFDRFNTVFVYTPGGAGPRIYDKMYLVLFGEFIPFRGGRFHRFYNWLNDRMPWQDEYSLTGGTNYQVFEAPAHSRDGRVYRFASPICYEITMSDVCRRLGYGIEGKRADLLINLSNDGWFHYKSELPQHLAVAVFRAVENRVGLARSVNTGISALIDPKGRILEAMFDGQGEWRQPNTDRRDMPLPYKGFSGCLAAEVPVDPTVTLYMRWGNWLPIGCLIVTAVLVVVWWVDRTWLAVRHLRRGGQAPATGKPPT